MFLLSLSDSLAALAGKRYGKIRIFGKTLEGTITFFIASIIIFSFLFENIFFITSVALFSSLVELAPIPVNDNISLPVFSGLFMSIFR